ncbi:hypothetical protein GOODEAATRI_013327, partial [Goodea atripinnis]
KSALTSNLTSLGNTGPVPSCSLCVNAHSQTTLQLDRSSTRQPAGASHARFPLTCVRSDPEFRVTHEAGGRSQDGCLQEAVESEETDCSGVHPAFPAAPAAHTPHQREYDLNNGPGFTL